MGMCYSTFSETFKKTQVILFNLVRQTRQTGTMYFHNFCNISKFVKKSIIEVYKMKFSQIFDARIKNDIVLIYNSQLTLHATDVDLCNKKLKVIL